MSRKLEVGAAVRMIRRARRTIGAGTLGVDATMIGIPAEGRKILYLGVWFRN